MASRRWFVQVELAFHSCLLGGPKLGAEQRRVSVCNGVNEPPSSQVKDGVAEEHEFMSGLRCDVLARLQCLSSGKPHVLYTDTRGALDASGRLFCDRADRFAEKPV